MLDKSSTAFKNAESLKNKYLSNPSRAAFRELEEAAKNNYWAKRWLADIYQNNQQPWFNNLSTTLAGRKLTAYTLYLDLTKDPAQDVYRLETAFMVYYQDYIDIYTHSLKDKYAEFKAILYTRDEWYGKQHQYHEEHALFSAFCLALSQDIDANQGLSYLQTTSKRAGTSDVDKKAKFHAKVLLAFTGNDRTVLQLLRRQSPKEFSEVIETVLRLVLNSLDHGGNTQENQQILQLIREQNPEEYENAINALQKVDWLAPLIQKFIARKSPDPINQSVPKNVIAAPPSLYPQLAHHPQQITSEEKNTDDFFKDFSAMMRLLRTNEEPKIPAAANPFRSEPQSAEYKAGDEDKDLIELIELPPEKAMTPTLSGASNTAKQDQKEDHDADDKDLIVFEEYSFPEVPTQEPSVSISRHGISN